MTDDTSRAFVEIVETDGNYTLNTNVYEIMGDFSAGIINSDILGYAFEPEEPNMVFLDNIRESNSTEAKGYSWYHTFPCCLSLSR